MRSDNDINIKYWQNNNTIVFNVLTMLIILTIYLIMLISTIYTAFI